VGYGHRYLLVDRNRERIDELTVDPGVNWRVGDTVYLGRRTFTIVAIEPGSRDEVRGCWIVDERR
jgi:hypothetical protein